MLKTFRIGGVHPPENKLSAGQAIITADHGNADCLIDPVTKAPFTAHTTNPVPMILVGAGDALATHRSPGASSRCQRR